MIETRPKLVGLSLVLALSLPLAAQPDISGFWELRFDSRNVPRAQLSSKVTEADIAAHAKRDRDAIRWCNYLGLPYIMGDSAPLDIQQGRLEVIISAQAVSVARHIYIDGRKHVNPDVFDPTTNGDSIGHWEGDTLLVDTIGFANRGITSIPGGGFKTGASRLRERYRLLDGGKRLSVTFTWEDPNVFAEPHTYQYIYHRAPAETNARSLACDPFDEARTKFLTGAPAN
jgi:hypothetical protein